MSDQVPLDLQLNPVGHDERSLGEWLTTFHMAAVILDPYTYESAWILDPARRILRHFREADCRVAFIVTGTDDEATSFLGPITDEVLTLCDPDRALVKAAGLEQLPAFLHLAPTGLVAAKAEGWDPTAWREVAKALAKRMSWSYPLIPAAGDPVAFPGSPAAGAA
ncbi:MAG: hypothetical protein ACLFWR_07475 [Acidimicrobiales bacterium]